MSSHIVLQTASHLYVMIHGHVWHKMRLFVQSDKFSTEAGGIFIGSYRGAHLEITDCTTPFPQDVRRRHLFDRRDQRHQKFAMDVWHQSNRTETFVGEWHTHPESHPSPSNIDINTWKSIASTRAEAVVFLIVGIETMYACKYHGDNTEHLELLVTRS